MHELNKTNVKQNIKFSVIVPIYNVEEYLPMCIESIINQSYKDFELILVNDGSLDSCLFICEKYAQMDKRIKILNKKNGGLVSARIAGAEIASGEYAVCIDGDDWIEKGFLSEFSKIISKNEPDIVCGQILSVDVNNKQRVKNNFLRLGFYNKSNIEKEIYPYLICSDYNKCFTPSLCCKAIKMDLYKNTQKHVSTSIVLGEDRACLIPILEQAKSIYITNKVIYYYRSNASSITLALKPYNINTPKLLYKSIEESMDINKCDFKNQLNRRLCFDLFSVVLSQFYSNEGYKNIVERIKQSFEENKELYDEAFELTQIRGFINNLKLFLIRNKLFFIIWLIARIKKMRSIV